MIQLKMAYRAAGIMGISLLTLGQTAPPRPATPGVPGGPAAGGFAPGGFAGGIGSGGPGGFGGPDMSAMWTGNGATLTPDPAALQIQMRATQEEWTVIWNKLQRIMNLRAEVSAKADSGMNADWGDLSVLASGSSMEAPNQAIPGLGGAGTVMFNMLGAGAQGGPFSQPPQTTPAMPGMPPMPMGAGGFLATGQGNSVQTLLVELQTMLADKSTTDEQIRAKLDSVRAARKRAAFELDAAQKDLEQLLTLTQTAQLVALQLLD